MPLSKEDETVLCRRVMAMIDENPAFQELDDYVRKEIGEGFELMVSIRRTEPLPARRDH